MALTTERGCFVRTTNKAHHFKLTWTIENFLDYPAKVKTFLSSPPFICISGIDYGAKFYMRIYPRGANEQSKEFLSAVMNISELPVNVNDVKVSCILSLIDSRYKKANIMRTEASEHFLYDDVKLGCGWTKVISRDDLRKNAQEWLPDGHLTVECNIIAHFDLKNPVSIVRIQSGSGGLIASDLGAEIVKMIYQDKICPDIKLRASDARVFDGHKCVLSVRSPYFKAMFQHPMKENEEGLVDLSEDMNGQELEALLHYIYLGTPPNNLNKTARKLFQIGDMQGISGLKQLSEQTLIGQLNDDNAIDLFSFANQQGAKELRKAAAMQIANFQS